MASTPNGTTRNDRPYCVRYYQAGGDSGNVGGAIDEIPGPSGNDALSRFRRDGVYDQSPDEVFTTPRQSGPVDKDRKHGKRQQVRKIGITAQPKASHGNPVAVGGQKPCRQDNPVQKTDGAGNAAVHNERL